LFLLFKSRLFIIVWGVYVYVISSYVFSVFIFVYIYIPCGCSCKVISSYVCLFILLRIHACIYIYIRIYIVLVILTSFACVTALSHCLTELDWTASQVCWSFVCHCITTLVILTRLFLSYSQMLMMAYSENGEKDSNPLTSVVTLPCMLSRFPSVCCVPLFQTLSERYRERERKEGRLKEERERERRRRKTKGNKIIN